MRRLVVVALALVAVAMVGSPTTAAAQPTLTLEEWCPREGVWGFTGTVSGFQPNELITVDIEWNDGTGGTGIGPLPVDATGSFTGSLGTTAFTERIDVTVTWAGGTLSGSVEHPCRPPTPTSKDQCKDNGWRNFPGFKNEGRCVSFVATGGKNFPPG